MSTPVRQEIATSRRRRRPRARTLVLLAVLLAAAAVFIAPLLRGDPASGTAVAGISQVALRDNAFTPPVIQVEPGTTVTWTFDDEGTDHNVVGPDWNSGVQASGRYQHTFSQPGSYRYQCTLHSRMTGRVDVAIP